ncbi:Ras family protein [Hirsutella rhossiliensis]
MSKFTRLYLRPPRPQSLFGLVSLQTGTELITMAIVFNKVTGVYGLLAILTGYQLSLLQLSTYLYSIAVLAALVYLIPHIRRQSPFECLALAWVYVFDTAINALYTAAFGVEVYLASTASDGTDSASSVSVSGVFAEGFQRETEVHGKVVPQETAASMVLIVGLTLIRVYLSVVVMAYARQVLQKHMQLLAAEGTGMDEQAGPFAVHLPDGDGRRGWMGRLMVSPGRGYWLTIDETEEWSRGQHGKPSAGGMLAGEV